MKFMPELREPFGREQELAHLLATFNHVRETRKGTTIFLLGDKGSGRKALGRAVLKEAERHPDVITASVQFLDSELYPTPDGQDFFIQDPRWKEPLAQFGKLVVDTVPKAIGLAGAPLLSLIVQFVSQSQPIFNAFRQKHSLDIPDSPLVLPTLLRQAAQHHTVAVFLEDLTFAEPVWADLIWQFAREVQADLPILLLASVEASSPLKELRQKDLPYTLKVMMDSVNRSFAQALFLAPLSTAQIQKVHWRHYPVGPSLAHRLSELADGNALVTQILLDDWIAHEVVGISPSGNLSAVPENNEWVWGQAKSLAESSLKELLDEDSPCDLDLAADIMRMAALEGSPFTAPAIANALGLDNDELIDFFDNYLVATEDRPNGLLEEAGWATVTNGLSQKQHPLYAFRFLYQEHVWRKYLSDAEERRFALALVTALEKAYSPQADLQARKLARLSALAGKEDDARRYQRITNSSDDIQAMKLHIDVLEQIAESEVDLARLFEAKIAIGLQMTGRVPFQEVILAFESALETAKQSGNGENEAWSYYRLGWALSNYGDYTSAKENVDKSLEFSRKKGLHDLRAASLHILGDITRHHGDYAKAREYYEQAITIQEQLNDNNAQLAGTLICFGEAIQEQGNLSEARKLFQQSLAIDEELGQKEGIARNLHQLGDIAYSQDDYAEARKLYQEALAIDEELGEKNGIARNLHALGEIASSQDDYAEACKLFQQSRAIDEELGQKGGIAGNLYALGNVASSQDDYAEARKLYQEGLTISEELGEKDKIASNLYALGNIAYSQDDYTEARKLYQEALTISEELGKKDWIARALHALGKVDLATRKPDDAEANFRQ